MGTLFAKNLIFYNSLTAYQPFLSKNTLLSDQWMGIYFNDNHVGFSHTSIEPYNIKSGVSGYRIISRTNMNFLLLRKRQRVWFDAAAIVDENYQLVNFEFYLRSGMHKINVKGLVSKANEINLAIDSQGVVSSRKIVLPEQEGVILASIISPFNSFGNLSVGAKYNLKVLNPFTLALEPLALEVAGKEMLEHEGEQIEVFIVKSDYRGFKQTAWVNKEGEIIKEETALGWILRKESPDIATRLLETADRSDTELLEFVSLTSNMNLDKKDAVYLKLALSGVGDEFPLENQRQRLESKEVLIINKESIKPEEALSLPIDKYSEFLKATDFLQVNDEKIQKMAKRILKNENNSWLAAKKINDWVYKTIRKTPVVSIPSAIDVLNTREGDCNEHTALFTALARAAGIPAKVHVGLVYLKGRFYYHAWPSVYVGKWIDMDPTFGQDIADVSHIKLLEGDLNKQLDIVKLIGKIALEVIEYR
ncbi:MAG: transglutaminase domain-containing protein [PVC group bacterium]|nr:transglutaminase domain-containing protein [PVC group bacterium]